MLQPGRPWLSGWSSGVKVWILSSTLLLGVRCFCKSHSVSVSLPRGLKPTLWGPLKVWPSEDPNSLNVGSVFLGGFRRALETLINASIHPASHAGYPREMGTNSIINLGQYFFWSFLPWDPSRCATWEGQESCSPPNLLVTSRLKTSVSAKSKNYN